MRFVDEARYRIHWVALGTGNQSGLYPGEGEAAGRVGSEASMIAHAAQYGVVWEAGVRYPDPPDREGVWRSDRVWPMWKAERPAASQRPSAITKW